MDDNAADSSRNLLSFILDVTGQLVDAEPAAVIERLQQHRPRFINLLKTQVSTILMDHLLQRA